jgi:hypothetical protein
MSLIAYYSKLIAPSTHMTDTTATLIGPSMPKNKKTKLSNLAGSATIKPFVVCTDVNLGPLLTGQSHEKILETWTKINKNKDLSDPTKTERDVDPYYEEHRYPRREKKQLSKLEASSDLQLGTGDKLVVFLEFNSINLLAKAIHTAFYEHYPLRFSPDVIWLTILQGLAKHIDKDPETQRANFVNLKGKKTLVVTREEFVKGSPKNDWTTVIPEFASQIANYIGDEKASALASDFTTSSKTDQICAQIALMDTVKHYFEYMMMAGCGIPSIELAGTPEDWVELRRKAEILNKNFDLDWWTSELYPVLDQFVAAAQGRPDVKFWKNICNLNGGSGSWSSYVTGWVQVLFPYLDTGEQNWSIAEWRHHYEKGTGRETEEFNNQGRRRGPQGHYPVCEPQSSVGNGLKLDKIPCGISQAPVTYLDARSGKMYDYTFNGGIVAVLQNNNTRALEPVSGWAVLDHGERSQFKELRVCR